jgi:hypothetical protein
MIMRISPPITLSLFISINILFCINTVYPVKAQEFIENSSLSKNFAEIENSEIGLKMKYPEDWTFHYTKGSNNSITKEQYFKLIEDSDLGKGAFTDFEKDLFYQRYLSDCAIIDCNLIEDSPFLQAYLRSVAGEGYGTIFDYAPTLAILSPLTNSTDNFLESLKITSFTLPHNLTFTDFVDIYTSVLSYSVDPPYQIDPDCYSNLLSDYPGCVYGFDVGHNIENRFYVTFQFFDEKNDKVYLMSYNALEETYEQYIDSVGDMLESFEPI